MTKKINMMIRLIIERERLRRGRKERLSIEGSLEMDRRDDKEPFIPPTGKKHPKQEAWAV